VAGVRGLTLFPVLHQGAMELPVLKTERLAITLLQPGMELAMVDFLSESAAHFAQWDPPPPADNLKPARWAAQCANSLAEFEAGTAIRFVLSHPAATDRIVGVANATQISRGPFQAGFLGYKLARDCEGQGLMREALDAVIAYLFDVQQLHRIHANYVPQNVRSGRLLARLGFTIEGYAKDYLFINGAWRDHVLTSRTHTRFDDGWLKPRTIAPRPV
jgi:ribosomal-protein-alanine N-acetyltransferase